MAKLYEAGVGPVYLNFLDSYLQPRRATVVVEGTMSDEIEIMNTVFQRTVLGLPLWNTFFNDVSKVPLELGADPAMFADDLNIFKQFDRLENNAGAKRRMEVCRARVHTWGRCNRVSFDAGKEHLVVLHPISGEGETFRLLGCQVDVKLIMQQAIDKILTEIRPKVKAILRTRKHYDSKDLIGQFKTHIWSRMEMHNGAIFHASDYLLEKIERVQQGFLRDLEISEEEAYLNYNFAPPKLRRNIGILGLLHKRVVGVSHPVFSKLLPFAADAGQFIRIDGHDKQLYGHLHEVHCQLSMHFRSIFAMTYIYNGLPQFVIDADSVTKFQKHLSTMARNRCAIGAENWKEMFSCRDRS